MCYLWGHFVTTRGEIRTENLFHGQSAVSWRGQNVLFYSTYQQTTELFTKVVFKMCSLDWNVKCVHNKFNNSHILFRLLKKNGSLWRIQMEVLMENSTFHITCHLDPDAKIRVLKQESFGRKKNKTET